MHLKVTWGFQETCLADIDIAGWRDRFVISKCVCVPTSSNFWTVSLHWGILDTKFEVVGLLRSSRVSRMKSLAEITPGIFATLLQLLWMIYCWFLIGGSHPQTQFFVVVKLPLTAHSRLQLHHKFSIRVSLPPLQFKSIKIIYLGCCCLEGNKEFQTWNLESLSFQFFISHTHKNTLDV